jgi:hypothetical protein
METEWETVTTDIEPDLSHPQSKKKISQSKKQEEPFTCSQWIAGNPCKKMFKTNEHLLKHMDNHNEESCHLCDINFKSEGEPNAHMRDTHKEEDGDNNCKLCPNEYNTKQALEKHMDLKHNNSDYSCKFCHSKL